MIIIGPLWILNLPLFGLHFLLIFFFIFHLEVKENKINWNNKSNKEISLFKSNFPEFDFIKNQDIFSTKVPLIQKKTVYIYEPAQLVFEIASPEIPLNIPIQENIATKKEFLPPLQVALHGTLISENPMNNAVFLESINSKQEKEYKIGDTIEDAQIIFINKNKVIFVRSNGQEESIYLNKNLQLAKEAEKNIAWKDIIYYDSKNSKYYLNSSLFGIKISSFASFINEVGLTTVLINNSPAGCKMSKIYNGSIPSLLNIAETDVIEKINNIDINTPENRLFLIDQISTNIKSKQTFVLELSILDNHNRIRTIHIVCYQDSVEKEHQVGKIGFFDIYEKKIERRINEANN